MATPEERATAIKAAFGNKTLRYTYLGLSFTVSQITLGPNGAWVSCNVACRDALGPLPTDNPYIFVNPPLQVPTGPDTYVRDDLAAAKQMLYDAVVLVAGRLGWVPA